MKRRTDKKTSFDTIMYYLYKDDFWGNKVPVMVATRPYADQMLKTCKDTITRVVDVQHGVHSLLKL